jgi:hypothetical protein
VKGADIRPCRPGANEIFAEDALRMLGTKGHGIGARGELQHGVQAAWEMVVATLAEIFQMVFGKIVLYRQQLVAGHRGAPSGAASVAPNGLPLRMSQPGNSASGSSQQKSSNVALSLIRLSMRPAGLGECAYFD